MRFKNHGKTPLELIEMQSGLYLVKMMWCILKIFIVGEIINKL